MISEESGREKVNIADISDDKLLELIDLVRKTFNNFFEVKCYCNKLLSFLISHNFIEWNPHGATGA